MVSFIQSKRVFLLCACIIFIASCGENASNSVEREQVIAKEGTQELTSSSVKSGLTISNLVGIWEYTSPKEGDTYEVSTFQFYPDGSVSMFGQRFRSSGKLKKEKRSTGQFSLNGDNLTLQLQDEDGDQKEKIFSVQLKDETLYMRSGTTEIVLRRKTMAEVFK
jgi:hypothetical protein